LAAADQVEATWEVVAVQVEWRSAELIQYRLDQVFQLQ
jgi:hypothetical protein